MRSTSSASWALQAGLCWLATLGQVTASPVAVAPSNSGVELQSRDQSQPLKIMPLGASITAGFESEDGNGYRETLYDHLVSKKWNFEFVGSIHNGTMKDNANEGHIGDTIDALKKRVKSFSGLKPDVILLNIGSNDAVKSIDVDHAGDRMDSLLDELYKEIPGTTIILSTLFINKFNQTNTDKINVQIRKLEDRRYTENQSKKKEERHNIILAPMEGKTKSGAPVQGVLESGDILDGTHPTKTGYEKMAKLWFGPIDDAVKDGMFKAPVSASARSSPSEDTKAPEEVESSPAPVQSTSAKENGAGSKPSESWLVLWIRSLL